MARLGAFAIATALMLLAPTAGMAASDKPPPGDEAPPVDPAAPHNRSYLQAAFRAVRAESYLAHRPHRAKPSVPRHGKLGVAQRAAVAGHYGRVAELDFLADGANREHDVRLAEHIEIVRRRETARYFLQMQAHKVALITAWRARVP